jgi:chromate reductase, NAD(P)H dehydrogenase (quinone)
MSKPILIVAGSNRPNANAARLAAVVHAIYQSQHIAAEVFSLGELPPEAFAPTTYAEKPASIQAIQKRVLDAAGLHVITPEYNGSFPGVLKYFIDLLKFPDSFEAKPVAFIGEAAGTWGGLRAVEQLQMVFAYRNAHLFPGRVFIPSVHAKFDAAGAFIDADLHKRLGEQCAGFARYVAQLQGR